MVCIGRQLKQKDKMIRYGLKKGASDFRADFSTFKVTFDTWALFGCMGISAIYLLISMFSLSKEGFHITFGDVLTVLWVLAPFLLVVCYHFLSQSQA